MRRPRAQGFTLIELLVVISIISILAAMLFPTFARSRESARKTQCLGNIKNLAMAVNTYLVDYDRFPPGETRPEVLDFFAARPGDPGSEDDEASNRSTRSCANFANPYLRWAVILEEYVKDREVWRCPTAKLLAGAQWIVPTDNWFQYVQDSAGRWGRVGDGLGPCQVAWPPGWGGQVTDSIAQHKVGFGGHQDARLGAFEQTIAMTELNWGLNLSTLEDSSQFVVCGDGGPQVYIMRPAGLAYPDLCRLDCGREKGCCASDWENCPASDGCSVPIEKKHEFLVSPQARKPYARHLGGSNIGFIDGHAKWYAAEAILSGSPPKGKQLFGLGQTCGALAKGCPRF